MVASETLTVNEMATILRISRTKAYELANSKLFAVVKIGRTLRIVSASFYSWMNTQQ